jgi:hypothetical protein
MREDTNWQPISTAPKDGTVILIHLPDPRRKRNVVEAYWVRPCEGATDDRCFWKTVYGIALPEQATHWMPLPPAPPHSEGKG